MSEKRDDGRPESHLLVGLTAGGGGLFLRRPGPSLGSLSRRPRVFNIIVPAVSVGFRDFDHYVHETRGLLNSTINCARLELSMTQARGKHACLSDAGT